MLGDDQDPIEQLRAINPVPDPGTLPGPDSLRAQTLLKRIVAEPPAQGGRRRRRWLPPMSVLIPGMILVGGTAAAAWVLRVPDTTIRVGCYAEASLDADVIVVRSGDDPVSACRKLWQDGTLGGPTETTPPLSACTAPSGALVVLPAIGCDDPAADEFTEAGLAPERQTPDVRRVVDELVEATRDVPCADPRSTLATWREIVNASTLQGWSVTGDPDQTGCATLSVNEPAREFQLVVVQPSQDDPPVATAVEVVSRLRNEVTDQNLCLSAAEMEQRARSLLGASDPSHGEIRVLEQQFAANPDACADLALDSDERSIFILPAD